MHNLHLAAHKTINHILFVYLCLHVFRGYVKCIKTLFMAICETHMVIYAYVVAMNNVN